jgi:hypothetical protein
MEIIFSFEKPPMGMIKLIAPAGKAIFLAYCWG